MARTETTDSARVPLARLWRRESARGREYYVGRLGQARLLAFAGADDDGTPTIDLVLVPAEPRERQTPAEAPANSPSGDVSAARRETLRRTAHPRSAWRGAHASDGNPFD